MSENFFIVSLLIFQCLTLSFTLNNTTKPQTTSSTIITENQNTTISPSSTSKPIEKKIDLELKNKTFIQLLDIFKNAAYDEFPGYNEFYDGTAIPCDSDNCCDSRFVDRYVLKYLWHGKLFLTNPKNATGFLINRFLVNGLKIDGAKAKTFLSKWPADDKPAMKVTYIHPNFQHIADYIRKINNNTYIGTAVAPKRAECVHHMFILKKSII